jgi:proteic killer suppression protein
LEELYDTGQTTDKSHRFQPEVVEKYQERIRTMQEVPHIKALSRQRSLNLEKLKGDKKGQWSIRVDDKYRVSFTIDRRHTTRYHRLRNIKIIKPL